MQNDREAGQTIHNLFEDVKTKLRFLAGLELECTMAGTDSDCKRVNTGSLNEIFYLLRLSIRLMTSFYYYVIFDTC